MTTSLYKVGEIKDFFVPMGIDPEDGYWLGGRITEIHIDKACWDKNDVDYVTNCYSIEVEFDELGETSVSEVGQSYLIEEKDLFEHDEKRFASMEEDDINNKFIASLSTEAYINFKSNLTDGLSEEDIFKKGYELGHKAARYE